MRSTSLRLLFTLCLLTRSSAAWSQDERPIRKNDPSPFNGVVMTNDAYTKTYQELEACDIWKKYLKEKPKCEVDGEYQTPYAGYFSFFAAGILTGVIIGYATR